MLILPLESKPLARLWYWMTYAPITAIIATPIGNIHLWGDEKVLHGVQIDAKSTVAAHIPATGPVARAADELKRYFAGERVAFTAPLQPLRSPRGEALREGILSIGYGETSTYGALARKLDSGARAIGSSCRTNPFPIIVPCHRVVSADGKNAYYSGGEGAPTKAWLLAHEQHHNI